ncbi:MAG: hypothetical protein HC850_15670 [Rhodomicrobium sp.]|nr:hypothetical protein [Rhodomicrobium sp.]
MILRRITEHVKAQNWFAVFLDFVIVVVGVFIGLQVSNWNGDRALRAEENLLLAQLRDEIVANDTTLEYQSTYTEAVIASGIRALTFVEGEASCSNHCTDLLIDFFHASQVWGNPYEFAKYRETERLGFPSNPATRAAVRTYYRFMSGWDQVNLTPPAYRQRVRGHFSPAAATALWDRCHISTSQLEILSRDCADALDRVDASGMLEAIRADAEIANELRFWIGQNVFAQRSYADVRATTAAAILAIAKELGDAP